MKLITKIVFTLFLCTAFQLVNAQEFTLDFSEPNVNCNAATVCYDITLSSNGANFGLSNFNTRLFYDANSITFINNSPNLNNINMTGAYSFSGIDNNVFDVSGNVPDLGSLSFEDALGFLEIGASYTAATPPTPHIVSGISESIVENVCFNIVDQSLLTDVNACFDLIFVNASSRELYTNSVTTLNNASNNNESADLVNSIYNDLTMANNCLADNCTVDPDPLFVYELGFANGRLDCATETVCYDVTIEAPEDFDLGSYNLRIYYDADLLDLIDASPNLSPGTQLDLSYSISSINDMQGGSQVGNGSLPFEDNLDIIDIAVDYLGSNPIVATTAQNIITHDLCFNILDQNLILNPSVCIHAVWVTNATEELYTVGETTVNVAGGVGVTTDLDNSFYNDLEPTGGECLIGACVDSDIPTMGEWGLICLTLILLIFGVVAIRETASNLSEA